MPRNKTSDVAVDLADVKIDATDLKILDALQKDCSLSNIDLADKVGLSPSPCLRRVKILEQLGVIDGYRAHINRHAVGLGVRAFVEVRLERQSEDTTNKFLASVQKLPEVENCYLMTGGLDYLLDVVATDLLAYADFTTRRLIGLPGVKEIRSSFVLKEVGGARSLPLSHMI